MSDYTPLISTTPDHSFLHLQAMRHERYAHALELLSNPGFVTRLGAVKMLARLIDEWLDDEHTPEGQRIAEAQIVVDTLCACIYAPFPLIDSHRTYRRLNRNKPKKRWSVQQKEQFRAQQQEFRMEARFRQSILDTIHSKVMIRQDAPGPWSHLSFNFSKSVFFYPVALGRSQWDGALDLRECTFYDTAEFTSSVYAWHLNCSNSTFYAQADLSLSTYNSGINASFCTFWANADFDGSLYRASASLSYNVYWGEASLSNSTYEGHADLACCLYASWASLSNCEYQRGADFFMSTYATSADFDRCIYGGRANLMHSTYYGRVGLMRCTYRQEVTFKDTVYNGDVDFSESLFWDKADFEDSAYLAHLNFQDTVFETQTPSSARSVYVPEDSEELGYNYGTVRILTGEEMQQLRQLRQARLQIEHEISAVDYVVEPQRYRGLHQDLLEASRPIGVWCRELMAGTR